MVGKRVNVVEDGAKFQLKVVPKTFKSDLMEDKQKKSEASLKSNKIVASSSQIEGSDRQINRNLPLKKLNESQNESFEALFEQTIQK